MLKYAFWEKKNGIEWENMRVVDLFRESRTFLTSLDTEICTKVCDICKHHQNTFQQIRKSVLSEQIQGITKFPALLVGIKIKYERKAFVLVLWVQSETAGQFEVSLLETEICSICKLHPDEEAAVENILQILVFGTNTMNY